jgi:hypothetical protein
MEAKKKALEVAAVDSEPRSAACISSVDGTSNTPRGRGSTAESMDAKSMLHAHHVSSMEYAVSQPTLEQVFLHFAKEQRETPRHWE